MAAANSQFQLVTFQLGEELYGVDIMDVKEIVKVQTVRPIPNAPYYVEGIFNLRSEIIPIINLHKRFRLKKIEVSEDEADDEFQGGFIILNIDGLKIGIIIDRVARVMSVKTDDILINRFKEQKSLVEIAGKYENKFAERYKKFIEVLGEEKIA